MRSQSSEYPSQPSGVLQDRWLSWTHSPGSSHLLWQMLHWMSGTRPLSLVAQGSLPSCWRPWTVLTSPPGLGLGAQTKWSGPSANRLDGWLWGSVGHTYTPSCTWPRGPVDRKLCPPSSVGEFWCFMRSILMLRDPYAGGRAEGRQSHKCNPIKISGCIHLG